MQFQIARPRWVTRFRGPENQIPIVSVCPSQGCLLNMYDINVWRALFGGGALDAFAFMNTSGAQRAFAIFAGRIARFRRQIREKTCNLCSSSVDQCVWDPRFQNTRLRRHFAPQHLFSSGSKLCRSTVGRSRFAWTHFQQIT